MKAMEEKVMEWKAKAMGAAALMATMVTAMAAAATTCFSSGPHDRLQSSPRWLCQRVYASASRGRARSVAEQQRTVRSPVHQPQPPREPRWSRAVEPTRRRPVPLRNAFFLRVRVSVCVSVGQSVVPNLGAQKCARFGFQPFFQPFESRMPFAPRREPPRVQISEK